MSNLTLVQKIAILQLEQYDYERYSRVIMAKTSHTFDTKRLLWTYRARLTYYLTYLLGLRGANFVISLIVMSYENWEVQRTKSKILELKKSGLKVIAIAGSYGKTSVKNNLYDILRTKYRVVATPESFNTVLGIAKCLEWEVDDRTQIFVVEVGAYKIGDITRLLDMISPDIGILTGIARQHLERFGSFANIQKAKGEIVEYMMKLNLPIVANTADLIVDQVVTRLGAKVIEYGEKGDRLKCNLEGAQKAASVIGMSDDEIKRTQLRLTKNRFEMTTQRYGMRVIDDSFSSNDVGFMDAVSYLGKQIQYTRILVTPGIVELGSESDEIHRQLGASIADNCDLVMLVGKNERTQNLAIGIGKKVKVLYLDKTLEFVSAVNDLKLKKEPLVLIENDVTENYI